jgi:hypothetical protein
MLKNVTQGTVFGQILYSNLSNEKWMKLGKCGFYTG